jgi:predicted CoA-binding protein
MATVSEITAALKTYRRIAVVGLSPDPTRPSHAIFEYLIEAGYDVVGVNPALAGQELLGRPCFAKLEDVPGTIDIVDVFRRSTEVPPIAASAIAIGAKMLWLQDGVTHPAAEKRAADAGLIVVSDRCILRDHRKFVG